MFSISRKGLDKYQKQASKWNHENTYLPLGSLSRACDQFLFLHRCGFDAFEVAETDAAAWHAALAEFRVWYQPTGDGRAPALALRHRAQAAE